MIASRKATVYGTLNKVRNDVVRYAVCAYCGEEGPPTLGDDQDAHRAAIANGWHARDAEIGCCVYTCPVCLINA